MSALNAAGRQPLPIELHAATRIEHASLNRSIIARLPLCLPNATSDPTLYACGMTVYGQIYFAFEEAWDALLSRNDLSQEQTSILTQLKIPRLRRTERLDTGLERLTARLDPEIGASLLHLQKETLHFRQEISQSILAKPHLLLSYTWTMYLALFNGGRWMAKQFLNAGPAFWHEEERTALVLGSLSFWFFGEDEEYSGEDLKVAFKEAFHEVSQRLTDSERDDIIAETKKLFGVCVEMIEFLDQHVQANAQHNVVDHGQPVATRTTEPAASIQDMPVTAGYLASYAPAAVVNLWHAVASKIPRPQGIRPIILQPEIEQKH